METQKAFPCRYEGCSCARYNVHRFKFTLSCIDCGHLADFHDVEAEIVETSFSLSKSGIIQPLQPDFNTFGLRKPSIADSFTAEDLLAETALNTAEEEDDGVSSGAISQPPSTDNRPIPPPVTKARSQSSLLSPRGTNPYSQGFFQPVTDFTEFSTMTQIQEFDAIFTDTPDPSKFTTRRDYIIRELFTTEQSYVRNLTFLINEYKIPMQEDPMLEKECPRIFLSLPEILNTNKMLLHRLHGKVMSWDADTTIGDDLVILFPFLRMYKVYCASYDHGTKRVEELLKINPKFFQLNETNRAKPESRGLDIFSRLIMPVQRIPRYMLLLKDLVEHTPENHLDYEDLKQAYEKFKQLANEVNEGIRERESRAIIVDIQNKFSPSVELVASHRSLVTKGRLLKIGKSVRLWRYCYLFSDLFLNSKRNSDGTFQANHLVSIDELVFVPVIKYQALAFGIRTKTRSYTLICPSEQIYNTWVSSFNSAMEKARSRASAARPLDPSQKDLVYLPIWQPDNTSDVCMFCQAKFGVLTRKHHCRVCGLLVCSGCSSKRLQIMNQQERVCDECHTKYSTSS